MERREGWWSAFMWLRAGRNSEGVPCVGIEWGCRETMVGGCYFMDMRGGRVDNGYEDGDGTLV